MKRYCVYPQQIGAGLIEVMVSLLILGVGLLGVLSLQAKGLTSNQQAMFATEAQLLAEDMAERILAFGSTGSAVRADGGEYAGITVLKSANFVPTNNCSSSCDGSSTVSFDRDHWRQALSNSSLPDGRAQVRWSDPIYTIEVLWNQERVANPSTSCTADNCFSMQVSVR